MDVSKTYDACVAALREFVRGAGFTDVVIGLSGGIDSALTAVMAVDALGAQHVHGVSLPGPHSSDHSVDDARELAKNLGIDVRVISIDGLYAAFERALASACGGQVTGVVSENIQARSRMICIMALSNAHGWLMLNTGNRSESLIGYSTMYGDMAGAFAPLGSIYKTEVYACARWRNARSASMGEVSPIPVSTMEKPPSAELAPDQEDERSIGVDYATLDAVLVRAVDREMEPEAVALDLGIPLDQVSLVLSRVSASSFKRAYEPPCPSLPMR